MLSVLLWVLVALLGTVMIGLVVAASWIVWTGYREMARYAKEHPEWPGPR